MNITQNFRLEELTHSNTAKARGLKNEPSLEHIENLRRLVVKVLQPLRELFGKSMVISSGYRSLEVNKAVGGVPNSQHTKGQAADISVSDPRKLLATLLNSGIVFDQAILYQDGRNNFLHISYNLGYNRNQVLYSKGTKETK